MNMKILVLGLNHKTAPVGVRERLACNPEQTGEILRQLKERFGQAEFALLSTCNRVELYSAFAGESGELRGGLEEYLAEWSGVKRAEFQGYLYVHEDAEAVGHLLKVSCSLDSMVVGESQILGQVKDCYRLATAAQSTGKVLNRLFHCAFATSKEVYSTTSIAQRRVSVAGVAVELAQQLFADMAKARVVVIGAGEMGELLIKHLLEGGCRNITLINRTLERGEKVAQQYGIRAEGWERLADQVKQADMIIAAAVAEEYLFSRAALAKMIEHRRRALLIIDIAVPRNFDPAIHKLPDVYLYSVDDLASVAQENLAARQEDMEAAGAIVEDNVISFMDWFGVSDIGPLVGRMRENFRQVGAGELAGFLAGEPKAADAASRQQLEVMVNRTMNKVVHRLVNGLYHLARERGPEEARHFLEILLEQKDRSEK